MHNTASRATLERRDLVLATLRATANVSEAARRAGVARMTLYRWREADPEFAAAWDDAIETAIDDLEAVAWARARDGAARPIVRNGVVVGEFQRHSDGLMMFLLRALRPERYRAETAADRRAAREAERPLVVELLRFPPPEDGATGDAVSDSGTETDPAAVGRVVPGREGGVPLGSVDKPRTGPVRASDAGDVGIRAAAHVAGQRERDEERRAEGSGAVARREAERFGPLPMLVPFAPYEGRQASFEGTSDWEENWT